MLQISERNVLKMNKLDQYALDVSANERYQLQLQIANTVVQNLVAEIVKDIDGMNATICVGVEEMQNERRQKRIRRDKKAKWIWG